MPMKLGRIAFIIGGILALIVGFGNATGLYNLPALLGATTVIWVLIIAGVVIGFANISSAESTGFLVAIVAVTVVLALVSIPSLLGFDVNNVLSSFSEPLLALLAPAALVVGTVRIFSAVKN